MDIFENVEQEIGPFNTWPSYILQYIFCEPLNNYRLKILSAFFYGNGVSLLRTLDLFKACAPNFNLADRFVIKNLFTGWNQSQTSRVNIRFYNLTLNNISNLDGSKINTVSQTPPSPCCGRKALTAYKKITLTPSQMYFVPGTQTNDAKPSFCITN